MSPSFRFKQVGGTIPAVFLTFSCIFDYSIYRKILPVCLTLIHQTR